ncbi:hypothetical protein QWY93_02035 [Echinicola jeungdonensis]|uniref:Gfo/Idh/MocA family oxidoreductase n=1 Tax=Echinicola jeungdonensis TaxID=709343 RepID=A0ABV5J2Q2_9BACT|nr:Gfo/Idh/MocA family oxidoreductase [Echinicola jeungdonensis]MDN3668113.1 hypothetical protein [Echinicola jeungdonensis]
MNKQINNVLIYGFGRMGLTHYSILKGLNPNLNFTIVEPGKILYKLLKSNFNSRFVQSDERLNDSFDLTLVTTPPFIHNQILERSLARGDERIFVEKPFGGHTNTESDIKGDNVYIGYVLRYNPCIQWVKKNIKPADIISIKGQYFSNTIEKKPKGWRNGSFSGVLNEMGSHIIDLICYLANVEEFDIQESRKQSIISDVDDVVEAVLSSGSMSISLNFNWVKKEIRKPIFGLEIELINNARLFVDQQTIKIYEGDVLIKKVAVTDLAETVPYYLRGIDFTKQMENLLGNAGTLCSMHEALKVNRIMNNILK